MAKPRAQIAPELVPAVQDLTRRVLHRRRLAAEYAADEAAGLLQVRSLTDALVTAGASASALARHLRDAGAGRVTESTVRSWAASRDHDVEDAPAWWELTAPEPAAALVTETIGQLVSPRELPVVTLALTRQEADRLREALGPTACLAPASSPRDVPAGTGRREGDR